MHQLRTEHARIVDFRNPGNNRFVAMRAPNYSRRADIVCFEKGLSLELQDA